MSIRLPILGVPQMLTEVVQWHVSYGQKHHVKSTVKDWREHTNPQGAGMMSISMSKFRRRQLLIDIFESMVSYSFWFTNQDVAKI